MPILSGLALTIFMVVGPYLLVFGIAARSAGYRLFSRRRWAMLRTGEAVCEGGPWDGRYLPVGRWAALGFKLPKWPRVIYSARTGDHFSDSAVLDPAWPSFRDRWERGELWMGTYNFCHLSDRYRWDGIAWSEWTMQDLYRQAAS